ncbi:D-alanyl-D-alanine-carboxypeptidase/endopeptidase AmpH precursor [Tsuneonella dongtanensis]|uniref:D-alanyl-D-alanine-carboxypeptidase/endopeptidase AmpH n=1 Tax=Tsuneonella dongtanensis TaxID=692370 RepID=A0A1B2AED0_9SPHN|nr:serine hydrolase domain-containing protein [Tsuneonella dongtanensis]ANY20503.1 D-alanyl-D-alanine-carboxypeptidase/endopeptidase AmpH precursor [Tsuneonella dongtanensis]
MKISSIVAAGALFAFSAPVAGKDGGAASIDSLLGEIHAIYETDRVAAHVPGTVYGIVSDGKLVFVEGLGTRDPKTGVPVDAYTRFRIASMSKAFTGLAILHLRDEGRIDLGAAVSRYVPEVADWRLPTADSRAPTVSDLLHHTAGLVEDNPWGDRQQVLTEPEFTQLIGSGMDFANAPGTEFEYSNYGYALLGRIITNVSGKRYQDYIRETIMLPLGMASTSYDVFSSPASERAIGYRWQDDEWVREPDMRDGAFGAMGGVETTANDYAKWMAFLLSAWPPSDAPETGPVRRSTVRDLVSVVSYAPPGNRPEVLGAPCRWSAGYGAGLRVLGECELGRVLTHSGGYPGYGSHMALVPSAGVGIFVFNNATYTSLGLTNYKALLALRRAGAIPDKPLPISTGLTAAYELAKRAWASGTVAGLPLANNVVPDRDLGRRSQDIATIKQAVGACETGSPVVPVSAMEGRFEWTCTSGRVAGRVQRAPTADLQLQVVSFAKVDNP